MTCFCSFSFIAKENTAPGKDPSSKTDEAHSQAGGVPEVITSPLLYFEAAWALINTASGTLEQTQGIVKGGWHLAIQPLG